MKNFLVLLILLPFTQIAFSQADAKKYLDEVSAKIKSYNGFSLDYTYTINGKNSNGNLAVSGNKYLVNFMGVTQLYDGAKTYMINPGDQEITISKKAVSDQYNMANILSFYKTGYTYKMDAKKTENGKSIQYLKLIPTKSNSQVKEVILGINTASKLIYKKIDVLKNGSKNTLVINSFKANPKFSKNHFTFVKANYPKYYINHID